MKNTKAGSVAERFAQALSKLKLDAFLVTKPSSITYLTGFRGLVPAEREAYVLYVNGVFHLIGPRLYEAEVTACASERIIPAIQIERTYLIKAVADLLKGVGTCGFESEDLKYIEYEYLTKHASKVDLQSTKGVLSDLRVVKQDEEIALLRKAQEITYEAYENALPRIKIGLREFEVREIIASEMRKLGAEGESFDAIVAVDKNSALPHYATGADVIKKGSMVLMDFGALYKGYCGDTTRMLFFGTPHSTVAKTYELVLKAQQKAIDTIKAGLTCGEAFDFAAGVLKDAGEMEYFTHGLGHGIGLDVHEKPYLRTGEKEKLKEGMVFSIEPGLYYPEWGGIRIEDLAVCTESGVDILGNNSRKMRIVR